MSSQLALEASVEANLCGGVFRDFPDQEKCLKRNGKRIFRKAVPNYAFLGHESVLRFRDAILRIAG